MPSFILSIMLLIQLVDNPVMFLRADGMKGTYQDQDQKLVDAGTVTTLLGNATSLALGVNFEENGKNEE